MYKILLVLLGIICCVQTPCVWAEEGASSAEETTQVKTEEADKSGDNKTSDQKKQTTQAPQEEQTSPTVQEALSNKPRIGRGEPPLDTLIVNPAPRVEIDLPVDEVEEEITSALPTRLPTVRTPPLILREAETSPPKSAPPPAKKRSLHDVTTFQVSGLTLGMPAQEAVEALLARGFKIVEKQYGMPVYRRHAYVKVCKAHFYILTDIQECMRDLAKKDGVYYLAWIKAINPEKREAVRAIFTTQATQNRLYKFYYENKGDTSIGWGTKAMAHKMDRLHGFWNLIFDLYDYPDDPQLLVWGDLEHAYMQATMAGGPYNAYLVLADKDLEAEDYFAAEDAYHEVLEPVYLPSSIGTPLPADD